MVKVDHLRGTQAIIHTKNLRKNFQNLRNFLSKDVKICAVVKGNAYGHGMEGVAQILESEGADGFGVACLAEGYALRQSGCEKPIYMLGLCLPQEMPYVIESDLIPLACSVDEVCAWEAIAKKTQKTLAIQVAVDTGMGRIGCGVDAIGTLVEYVHASEHLRLEGVTSHFARADEVDPDPTQAQVNHFEDVMDGIKNDEALFHLANSAGVLRCPAAHYDMVRPGLLLYGYSPLSMLMDLPFKLFPVMQFVSRVLFMKKVKPGTAISYGGRYITERETWIATLGVGYADGYNRLLGNKGHVMIRGKMYPVVGTICMDQTMVDLGPDTDVQLYDEVTLFGDEEQCITADHIAAQQGTISYEILTSISPRVPRIFDGGH